MFTNDKKQIDYITYDELKFLLICALRYCMGRNSYAPGLVIEITERYIPYADDNFLAIILCDLDHIQEYSWGDPDAPKYIWQKFRKEIEHELNLRNNRKKLSSFEA